MRTSHLGLGQVCPGEVTAWVPTLSSGVALQSWPTDPRPLTHDQEQRLVVAQGMTDVDPDEAPWIGFSCLLREADPESVAATLASLHDRHESLRCDYVAAAAPHGGTTFVRRVLPAGAVEFEPLALGRHATSRDVHAVLTRHLARTASPLAWPYAGYVTVESEGVTTLYAAFDHITFDGGSMYALADEVPLLHRVFAAGDAPDPALALAGSHLDHAATERDFTREITAEHPLLQPWRDLLDDSGQVPGLPPASGVRRGDLLGHDLVSLPVATPGESAEFAALCRDWGVAPGLGYVAMLLRAIAAQEGPGPTRIAAMMSTPGRHSPEHRGAVGWFAGLAPLVHHVDPAADLREATLALAEVWDAAAPAGRLPLPLVSELLGVPVEPGLVVSYNDSRHCPGWRDWRFHEIRGLLGHVPRGDQMHAWINGLSTGTFLEVRHPSRPECAGWVATLAVNVRRTLLASLDPRQALVPAARGPVD